MQASFPNALPRRYLIVYMADDSMADAALSAIRDLDLKSGIKLELPPGAGAALLLSLRAWSR